MQAELKAQLEQFDGVHVDALAAMAEQLEPDAATLDALCQLAQSEESRLQVGATWLLKHYAENGAKLSNASSVQLIEALAHETHWEARLHFLQMLPRMTIAPERTDRLWSLLLLQAEDGNKFIRAWAFGGLAMIADAHETYRPNAIKRLRQAQDEAASIRARIRQLRRRNAWLDEALD